MVSRIISYTPIGLEAHLVQVEVDAGRGLPGLSIIGLPDQTVREAKERVRAAIANSQFLLPSQRITVNLAPADLKKEGGVFDLGIALSVLAAAKQIDPQSLSGIAAVGELSLDGRVRPIAGVLPMALAAQAHRQALMLPAQNLREASLVQAITLIPVATLQEAVDILSQRQPYVSLAGLGSNPPALAAQVDFSDVKGQVLAKRAIEVAVAGSHHLLLIGPPGCGKSMLAQRIPTILPEPAYEESIQITAIHSVAGLTQGASLIAQRPFRAPHHTLSAAALVGGGPQLKPGELSLAHNGVLFLDEFPEFHRDVIESLRQPLEEGVVRIARAKRSIEFPSQCLLVAAMNPCPCGYLADTHGRCRCSSHAIASYLGKLSGPVLDRIDLHVEVQAVAFDALEHSPDGESSAAIRGRVTEAQAQRTLRGQSRANAHLNAKEIKRFCELTPGAFGLLKSAMQELGLSARSYAKLLKIARTVADLAQSRRILPEHIAEAIQYRSLDRQLWL